MDFRAGLQSGPFTRGEYYYIEPTAVKIFLEHVAFAGGKSLLADLPVD